MTLYQTMIVTWSILLLAPSFSWAQSIVAAVLPSSRSVRVGTSATAFATIVNSGSLTATSCGVSLITPIPSLLVSRPPIPSPTSLLVVRILL